MKISKVMKELHKIREKMSKLSKHEFDKRMANALKGWEIWLKNERAKGNAGNS